MIIRVGIPSYNGEMCSETKATIERLKNCNEFGLKFDVVIVKRTSSYRARNVATKPIPSEGGSLIKQTMPYDYYLSTDEDMAFDVGNVKRLIEEDLDIISGAYVYSGSRIDKVVAGNYDAV